MKHLLIVMLLATAATAQTSKVIGIANLQNYWPLYDGSGSTATATVGGVNGTLTNATWDANGVMGPCLSFNGTTAYVTCGTAFEPANTQPWSLAFWFYPTSSAAQGQILDHAGTGGLSGWQIQFGTGGVAKMFIRIISSAGNGRFATAPNTVSLNAWHFGVCTWDGSATVTAYVDTVGHANDTVVGTVGALSYGGNFAMGREDLAAADFYAGKIDDVKGYYHAMTQPEINYLYYCGRQAVQ